ncbi:MAG: hypothetical protein WCA46_02490 [Actinocatenispora sp.]
MNLRVGISLGFLVFAAVLVASLMLVRRSRAGTAEAIGTVALATPAGAGTALLVTILVAAPANYGTGPAVALGVPTLLGGLAALLAGLRAHRRRHAPLAVWRRVCVVLLVASVTIIALGGAVWAFLAVAFSRWTF